MQKLDHACGWKPITRPDWPKTMWELIITLTEQERPHGSQFSYRSIETDILALVLERTTGTSLAELLSSELWAPMGAEEDAYITVDPAGMALADGGFNATLRLGDAEYRIKVVRGTSPGLTVDGMPADYIAVHNGGKFEVSVTVS